MNKALTETRPIAAVPLLVETSVDMARVIRRSVRCFCFGLLGLIPFLGFGLAFQAIRLHRLVRAETGAVWKPPELRWYWILGLGFMAGYDFAFDLSAAALVFIVFLSMQTRHLCRSLSMAASRVWNPAERELHWGLILAQAGLFTSAASLELFLLRPLAGGLLR